MGREKKKGLCCLIINQWRYLFLVDPDWFGLEFRCYWVRQFRFSSTLFRLILFNASVQMVENT
ncbi:hypothetical protein SDJN02_14273, partial [Cucurbita argyrosperma subsp. argyrosperma]